MTSLSPSPNSLHAFTHLRSMFPHVDPAYLEYSIHSYPSTFTADKLIGKVASKMLDLNHGNWPSVLLQNMARLNTTSRKGKGRENPNPLGQGTLLQVDETASRNAALVMLNEMFPEVDLGHLRQCLLDAPHSYLYTSLATLLSDSTLSPDAISQWHASDNSHRSRRTSTQRKHEPLPKRQNPGEITYADLIKDEIYADGTLQLLCAQFPNIWKSSIKAIMAEHNNDYFASVEAVKRIQEERPINFFARTWAAFTQAFSNKPTPPNSVTKEDFSIASYLSTLQNPGSMSPMLLYELQLHLSATQPQSRPSTSPRKSGGPVSQHLKYQDIECGCCFSDISVEQATTCAEGCLFCKECLARTVQESVYGQASLRLYREPNDEVASNSLGIDVGGEGTGIRCLSIEGCQASFSDKELQRCISSELYKALEDRLIQQNLQILQVSVKLNTKKKGARKGESVRIVQCPFCAYVEVEDVPTVSYLWKETSSPLEILRSFASIVTIGMIYLSWTLSAVFVPELLNTSSQRNRPIVSQPSSSTQDRHDSIHLAIQPIDGFQAIQDRVQQIFDTCLTKSSGTVFRCRNMSKATQHNSSSTFASPAVLYSMLPPPPLSSSSAPKPFLTGSSHTCGRASCRLCLKLYYPGHECVDSTAGLRLLKEQAASNAIKRQCPECGLSFVKDNGCNKIVCRCGYVMCFVCRKGIAEERYAHFCQHVRDPPGSACTVCTKCDLFKEEDERLAVKRAVKRAEQDWLREHPDLDAGNGSAVQGVDDCHACDTGQAGEVYPSDNRNAA